MLFFQRKSVRTKCVETEVDNFDLVKVHNKLICPYLVITSQRFSNWKMRLSLKIKNCKSLLLA